MEKNSKLLSVIVPVYKAEKYLNRCVDSILTQTWSNLEVILVDDGSPDRCGQICDEYASKDSRIRVIHKPNGGVSSARNAGIDAATGDYIAFVDSDDYLRQDMYKLLMEKAKEGYDIVLSDFIIIYPEREEVYRTFDVYNDHNKTFSEMLLKGYGCNVWNMIIRKDILATNIISFSENLKYCEDWQFCVKLHSCTDSVAKVNDALYYYNLCNPDQATGNQDLTFLKNGMVCLDDCIKYLTNKGKYKGVEKAFTWNILQTKTNMVFFPEYYGMCREWHPNSISEISGCKLISRKMRILLILNKFHLDKLMSLIVRIYK